MLHLPERMNFWLPLYPSTFAAAPWSLSLPICSLFLEGVQSMRYVAILPIYLCLLRVLRIWVHLTCIDQLQGDFGIILQFRSALFQMCM